MRGEYLSPPTAAALRSGDDVVPVQKVPYLCTSHRGGGGGFTEATGSVICSVGVVCTEEF